MKLPERVTKFLHDRGLTDETIGSAGIGWDGRWIKIPFTRSDGWVLHKLRRDPALGDDSGIEKYMTERDGRRSLYLREDLKRDGLVVIAEGELDALRIKNDGGIAVSSTTGANSWDDEWSPLFKDRVVCVWYDSDESGVKGAKRTAESISSYARETWIAHHDPTCGKDVTEYLVRTGQRFTPALLRSDKRIMLTHQKPVPPRAKRTYEPRDNPDLISVMEHYGLQYEGDRKKLMCPFHSGNSPSLGVDTVKGLWHCFGCNAGGTAYDMVMLYEECDFKKAKELMKEYVR